MLPLHRLCARSNCLVAITMLLLYPWSSASHSGPRPMHISLRPLQRLWSVLHGLPAMNHAHEIGLSHPSYLSDFRDDNLLIQLLSSEHSLRFLPRSKSGISWSRAFSLQG